MDLMAHATIFAQIVGLIATFSGERASGKIDQKQDFLVWLETINHQETRRLLETNGDALEKIRTLLNGDHEFLRAKLERVDELLAKLLSHIEGFATVAAAIRPTTVLSEQAVSILRQLDRSGASSFQGGFVGGTPLYFFVRGEKGCLVFDDPRFVADDLCTLVDIGLLRRTAGDAEKPVYTFTRAGSQYVRLLDE